MGAQLAIFAADSAEPEPLENPADDERSEQLCLLVTEDGGNRPDIGPAIEISEEAIRQRSKQIWEREGCPEGCAQDHWMRARAELAELMAKTSNAHLTAPVRPKDDIAQSILVPACATAPEESQSTQSAAAPDSQEDVPSGDVETDPQTLSRQHAEFFLTRDEFVSADPRPLRLSLTKGSKQTPVVPSIICAGLVLRGVLESPGEIQFDGTLEGDICCAGLAVGEEAFIQGDVVADDVTVRGRIRGRVRARNVRLISGSLVEGDILYGTLAVESGAQLDGSFQRLEAPLVQELAAEDRGVPGAPSQERPLSQSAA
jgi:cytoskeletal protein CcmA (bactofilin family)